MTRLLLPVIFVAASLVIALLWVNISNRLARLERELADLRREILFLRGEFDEVQRQVQLDAELEELVH